MHSEKIKHHIKSRKYLIDSIDSGNNMMSNSKPLKKLFFVIKSDLDFIIQNSNLDSWDELAKVQRYQL